METIRITFKTITPLWTGDAWRENREIRPSSLLGSLRFWFEVICYFAGITNESDYENGKLKANLNIENFNNAILGKIKKGSANNFHLIDTALAESDIPLPARIFGCTGWKGLVRVKEINYNDKDFNDEPNGRIISGKNWFWKTPSYQGQFSVDFEIKKEILNFVFVPLMNFMEQYGFWGGAWNIGFGRLRWESEQIKSESREFKFSEFKSNQDNAFLDANIDNILEINPDLNSKSKSFDLVSFFLGTEKFYCATERNFQSKTQNLPKKIKLLENLTKNNSLTNVVSDLLKLKANIRNCLRPNQSIHNKKEWNDFRHNLLGVTSSNGAEGTKIIPWITEDNGELKGGLISIAGILNLVKRNSTKKKNN
ncbi:type III-B CRISPR module RAMP protein Cmr1 [Caldithrix abyssi]